MPRLGSDVWSSADGILQGYEGSGRNQMRNYMRNYCRPPPYGRASPAAPGRPQGSSFLLPEVSPPLSQSWQVAWQRSSLILALYSYTSRVRQVVELTAQMRHTQETSKFLFPLPVACCSFSCSPPQYSPAPSQDILV